MFVIFNDEDQIVAYNESKKICKRYIESQDENEKLYIKKIRKLDERNIYELHLVRYGEIYIQQGYIGYLELSSEQFIHDEIYCKDILYRILEMRRISEKDSKKIMKVIKIIDNILFDDERYTPSLDELNRIKEQYDSYKYKIYKE